MKILIDLTSLADNFSGIERYAACLSEEMIQNCDYNFILIFKNQIHPLFEKYKNLKRIEIKVIPGCRKLIFNQIRLPIEIYKYKADVYLFLAFPVPVFLFKKNMISTIHDICCWDCPETMNGLSNWYFRISHIIAMKKCKAIITISEFSKKRIVERLGYPENNIWIIYCGIDKKFLDYHNKEINYSVIKEKYHLPDEYILSLSTLEPRKNIRFLVEAYSQLVDEGSLDIPLVLAGRKGWKMDNLLEQVSDKTKQKISFTDFIDDADLAAVYGNASLFVFPSMYEGFGMPPLEALACGTRVLSSDTSSLPEVLGDSASYFKNQEQSDFKEKLLLSLRKAGKENNINRFDYEMQVSKFNWKVEAKKLLKKISKM